jgi:hypothetical protein
MRAGPTLLTLLGLGLVLAGIAWMRGGRAIADDPHLTTPSSAAGPTTVMRAPELSGAPSEPERAPSPADHSTRRVAGAVYTKDGPPLPGVPVVLLNGDSDPERATELARTVTGRAGAFSFATSPGDETLYVGVYAPGFRDAVAEVRGEEELRIVLVPRGERITVAGRVVGDGRLLPEFLYREEERLPDSSTWVERWLPAQQSSSGFALSLPTSMGDVLLAIRARGFLGTVREVPTGEGSMDVGEIVLERSTSYLGRVVNEHGSGVSNARIETFHAFGFRGPETRSAADGGFELQTKEGTDPLAILVSAQQYAPRWMSLEEAGGVWDGVVVRLDAGARIEGRVVRTDGGAPHEYRVFARLADTIVDAPPGSALGSSAWLHSVAVDAAGSYVLEGVPRGNLTLGVGRRQGDFTTMLRVRALDVAADALYVCDFTLGDGAEVHGKVGFPDEDDRWLCLELRAGDQLLASMDVNANQPFVFEDVPLPADQASLTLRISVAPGFYAERQVVARGPRVDLGVFAFPDFESLFEFNRGERKIFEIEYR